MARKGYSTPSYIKHTFKKQTRIVIPQTPERPFMIKGKDVVRWAQMRGESWWFTLHKRGIFRPKLGIDPLEARAISKDAVKGTLPERIMLKALIDLLRFRVDVDFDFQSSLQGGRIELGGMVADFLFPYLKIVIQVQGATHTEYLRSQKDDEQWSALKAMGYEVFFADEATIYNEYLLEEWLRRTFNLASSVAGSGGALTSHNRAEEDFLEDSAALQQLIYLAKSIWNTVDFYGHLQGL
jgi:hypothetical protein